jgi:hypothetical protein
VCVCGGNFDSWHIGILVDQLVDQFSFHPNHFHKKGSGEERVTSVF